MAGTLQADSGPRVVPRVFADVPTQAELQAVRKSRNSLAVWLVLLIGILIAAIAGLVFLYMTTGSQIGASAAGDERLRQERSDLITKLSLDAPAAGGATAVANATPEPGTLDERVVDLMRSKDGEIRTLTEAQTRLQEQVRELETDLRELSYFSPLQAKRLEAAEIRADIAALLASPDRANASSNVNRDAWEVYNEGISWRDGVEAQLTTYVDTLKRVQNEILAWKPRVPTDPRPPSEGRVDVGEPERGAQ